MATLSGRRICDGCRRVVVGRCDTCDRQRRAAVDQARGTSAQRGYGSHWRNVIRPAFLREHPLCVICGGLAEVPDHWPETRAELVARGVTDPDAPHRLRPLCKDCHDTHGLSYKPWAKVKINQRVTVVAGPPCAGKNTYVAEHAQPDDVVIDYDAIMADLTGRADHEHDEGHTERARAIRDQRISGLLASGQTGWIITSSPSPTRRHQYRTRVVLLLPPQSVALERAQRERPAAWQEYIRRWYRRFEADPRDMVMHPTE